MKIRKYESLDQIPGSLVLSRMRDDPKSWTLWIGVKCSGGGLAKYKILTSSNLHDRSTLGGMSWDGRRWEDKPDQVLNYINVTMIEGSIERECGSRLWTLEYIPGDINFDLLSDFQPRTPSQGQSETR